MTPADAAELEVISFVLVRDVWKHRERCVDCAQAGSALYCHRVDKAIEEVLEWARFRSLLSRAERLRREQREAA